MSKRWAFLETEYIMDRDRKDLYLKRLILFRTPICSLYVHEFHQEDPDEFHDHPWDFITLPLRHGYTEEELDEETGEITSQFRAPGIPKFRRAKDLHRIRLNDKTVRPWSMCLILRRHRDWGFHTKQGWVQHEKFLTERARRALQNG